MGIALGTLLFRLISRDAAPAQSVVERIETADPAIIVAEGVLLVLYLRHLAKGKPEARLSVTMLLSGTWRYPFWVGVVGGALVLPLLLGGISLILPLTNLTSFRLFGVDFEVASILVLAAAVTVLCGGFLLRLGVLGVGIKERPPLYGLSKWRAEHGMPLVAIDVDDPSGG